MKAYICDIFIALPTYVHVQSCCDLRMLFTMSIIDVLPILQRMVFPVPFIHFFIYVFVCVRTCVLLIANYVLLLYFFLFCFVYNAMYTSDGQELDLNTFFIDINTNCS